MPKSNWNYVYLFVPIVLAVIIGFSCQIGRSSWSIFFSLISIFFLLVQRSRSLVQPPLQPPALAFALVWSLLYLLIGVSAFFVWQAPYSPNRANALVLFYVQLCFNYYWVGKRVHRADISSEARNVMCFVFELFQGRSFLHVSRYRRWHLDHRIFVAAERSDLVLVLHCQYNCFLLLITIRNMAYLCSRFEYHGLLLQ
jgi:hypothetical protein